ncbi:MAG: 4a-hydroxytetrahydrobiopterin dehydratase [Herbaspirillum sp.]|uniref:4a-hydroxytetrahydrobiopterin dehydratase n=1 Tax=Herbaspirillum sp. TaxID=1890675 RepID=UPI00258D72DA|nr:4a-hydroxytetrahydrobiopterin dehydratase [Herbaspirillum sp.]MCP4557385.1 4a-hydroxytetrahydrobiopterin dehydratase [Herbaspirillum sp.]
MKPERIQKQLNAHPGWTAAYPKQQLVRRYELPTFERAVQCANLVARKVRDREGEHAVGVTIEGSAFTLKLSSTADGNLTDAQFAFAGVIDEGVQELEGEVAT